MLLNNFKDWLYGVVNYNLYNSRGNVNYKDIDGNTVNLNWNDGNNFLNNPRASISELTNNGEHCVVLGTNDAPVTVDDCEWKNDVTDLSTVSLSFSRATVNGNRVIRATRSVTNNTENDITIREVGFVVNGYGNKKVLIAREVLDTPITVKANGGAQVFGIDIG